MAARFLSDCKKEPSKIDPPVTCPTKIELYARGTLIPSAREKVTACGASIICSVVLFCRRT